MDWPSNVTHENHFVTNGKENAVRSAAACLEYDVANLCVTVPVLWDKQRGTIVSVLGANGAGKTTVLKTISGAMDPQKGSVTFAGEDITARDPDRVARLGIGHVPEGREVFPFLSVDDNLKMGA